jgi:hypothetical protein
MPDYVYRVIVNGEPEEELIASHEPIPVDAQVPLRGRTLVVERIEDLHETDTPSEVLRVVADQEVIPAKRRFSQGSRASRCLAERRQAGRRHPCRRCPQARVPFVVRAGEHVGGRFPLSGERDRDRPDDQPPREPSS